MWETALSFTQNRSQEEENHKRLKNSTEALKHTGGWGRAKKQQAVVRREG